MNRSEFNKSSENKFKILVPLGMNYLYPLPMKTMVDFYNFCYSITESRSMFTSMPLKSHICFIRAKGNDSLMNIRFAFV